MAVKAIQFYQYGLCSMHRVISQRENRNLDRKIESVNGPIRMRNETFQHFTNAKRIFVFRIHTVTGMKIYGAFSM